MRVVTFKMDEDLLYKLDTYVNIKGTTRSEVIRKAIELYLKLEDWKIEPRPRIIRLDS